MTASAAGLVFLLLFVSVVQGQKGWGVTYTSTQICAVEGSAVNMRCSYTYPSSFKDKRISVKRKFWFANMNGKKPVDLKSDVKYQGRVSYLSSQKSHILKIKNVKESDSAVYKFSFTTNHVDGQYTAERGVDLFVTDVGRSCDRVIYADRSICAFNGSSVDIFCNYNSHEQVASKYWFSFQYGYLKSEDLSTDSQYTGRVQVLEAEEGRSTLRITDLRETDSGQYRFTFTTQSGFEWGSSLPGTTLTVTALQVQVTRVITRHQSYMEAELKCHASCSPDSSPSFLWLKNEKTMGIETASYVDRFYLGDTISCAFKGHFFHSPLVYAPRLPLVSVRPSGEIVEGSSLTLTCISDANPAANYSWYKNSQRQLGNKQHLVFNPIKSFDSGVYYCMAENELGRTRKSIFIGVKYPPRPPSVSVRPSREIVEGSSVTLTCSSDANPAANYTWYKENQTLPQRSKVIYFTSVSSSDRGSYSCKSDNPYGQINSLSTLIDVQYAPQLPSVSVRPSAEIVEGTLVTLTCSSDANPVANYTWYKENEESPKALGQIFTITDIRPEHSGKYYCEAKNQRGCRNTTLHVDVLKDKPFSVMPGLMKSAAGSVTAVIAVIIFLSAFLLIRRKKFSRRTLRSGQTPSNIMQEDPLYSNVMVDQVSRYNSEGEEDVEYTMVMVKTSTTTPKLSCQEAEEDSSVLYSTVNTAHRA